MIKAKLKNICNILNGYAFKSNNYVDDGIRIIRITNVQKGIIEDSDPKFYPNEEEKKLQKYLLNENDLLVSLTGNVGRVGLLRKDLLPAALNQRVGCIRIKDKNKLNIRYLFQLLNSNTFENICISNSKGIAQKNLSTEWLKEYEFIIPNMEEQLIIAEKLENIQKIITIKQSQLCKLDELIKSLFVEMFQSGNYPKDKLGKLCDVRDGTHDSPKYLKESKYKFITSKNITNNEIDFSDIKYISKQDYDNFNARSKVNNGDILMPMIGTIGNPIIVNIPDEKIDFAIKNVALIKFPTYSKVTNIYIKNLFDSDYFENAILHKKRGGTQKFIALSDIRTLKIEIPPIELQNKFAEFVNQIDKQKFEIQNSLNKMKALYETMMNKYFG